MKIIIIITSVFLLFSCSKKAPLEQKQTLSELPYNSFAESPLHPDLLKTWNDYIKVYEPLGVIDTAICYYFEFYNYKNDSILTVSFMDCDGKYSQSECKGMADINGFHVIVLDPKNIGKDFYNSELLIQKDISELKCFKYKYGSNTIANYNFRIKNNRVDFSEVDY